MLRLSFPILGFYHPYYFLLFGAALIGVSTLTIVLLTTQKRTAWDATGLHDLGLQIEVETAEKNHRIKSLRSLAEVTPPDLERRAILHKRWMMIAHDSQFEKPGTYRTYTIAEVPFFVIRAEDGKLRAFHNVCRHRAYTVVRKTCGNTLRLACKYHGWQYDPAGRLVKAPHFMDQLGFDASNNGLFEIHLKVDSSRFVFVNLATQLLDAFPWSDTSTPSLRLLNFNSTIIEWETEVHIGWRIASLLPWFVDPTHFMNRSWRDRLFAWIQYQRWPHLQYIDDGSFVCNFKDGCFLLVSAVPMGGSKTIIKCTYIPAPGRLPPSNIQSLADIEITTAVERLKKFRAAPANLDFRQSAVRERWDKLARHIDQHRSMEKRAGRKINPIIRVTGHDAIDVEAESICDALSSLEHKMSMECLSEANKELEW